MSTTDTPTYSRQDVLNCVAQAEKFAGHPNDGWAPDRRQCAVLAAEVRRLLNAEQRLRELCRDRYIVERDGNYVRVDDVLTALH